MLRRLFIVLTIGSLSSIALNVATAHATTRTGRALPPTPAGARAPYYSAPLQPIPARRGADTGSPADVKSHAASQHLKFPIDIDGELRAERKTTTIINAMLLLRQHPEYANATIDYIVPPRRNGGDSHSSASLISYAIQKNLYPLVQELISLGVHIPHSPSTTDHPLIMLIKCAQNEDLGFTLGYQMFDLMLKQGIDLYSFKRALQSMIDPYESSKLLRQLISYINAVEPEYQAKRAAAMQSALDPVLPPELQQISVDYAVPAEFARPATKSPAPATPKDPS